MSKILIKNHQRCYDLGPRLVFQNSNSSNPETAQPEANLQNVEKTFKEAIIKRIDFSKEIEDRLKPISAEKEQLMKIVTDMKAEMPSLGNQANRREFPCLGETIQIVMQPGEGNVYQEYINGEPINFLRWALDKKSKSAPINSSPTEQQNA